MSNYVIRQKASEDLEKIWLYTYFHWSESQADKYYPVKSHLIFYKISDNETITIVRILHQSMDIPNRLKE
jgi:toxin ParE1/3/4